MPTRVVINDVRVDKSTPYKPLWIKGSDRVKIVHDVIYRDDLKK